MSLKRSVLIDGQDDSNPTLRPDRRNPLSRSPQIDSNLQPAQDTSSLKGLDYLALWSRLNESQHQESSRSDSSDTAQNQIDEALDWTNLIEIDQKAWVGGGGFGDAFMGIWMNVSNDVKPLPEVVVKVMRPGLLHSKDIAKRYKLVQREIKIWNTLQHENIVPFIGVCYPRGPGCPALVSPYMKNRDVLSYLSQNLDVPRDSMLLGMARGLEFLHNFHPHQIVHGDVKGANILVNDQGQPCYMDFGISRMISDQTLWQTSSTHVAGSTRWQAPEYLDCSEERVTTEGDIYAFAMTCLEVITGSLPFNQYSRDSAVIAAILRGEKPIRPETELITPNLWNMWNQCWSREAKDRPAISELIPRLSPQRPPNSDNSSPRSSYFIDKPRQTFGVDLAVQMGKDFDEIPLVMTKCCQAIEKWGLQSQGIYSRSGIVSEVTKLKAKLDQDIEAVDLDHEEWISDINVVASAIKLWFRELPEPLLTYTMVLLSLSYSSVLKPLC